MKNNKIKVAIVGIGNCASSLIQGIHYYREMTSDDGVGLMHQFIGPYAPGSIEIVAAFDIDRRKVGLDVHEAIFQPPNCTTVFFPDLPSSFTQVRMGKLLDGYSEHMADYPEEQTFLLADEPEPSLEDVVRTLREAETEVIVNYLPVGSGDATRFYAECALQAGAAFVNNSPVFIASDPHWARRFEEAGLPLVGDDIKSQLGATITHRVLTDLFKKSVFPPVLSW